VFTPGEVAYCRSKRLSSQHFAVRFAAKEAVWKALSSDIARQGLRGGRPELTHRDIQVRNRDNGKPEVVLPARFRKLARRVSISLSHGREYAIAMALYQTKDLRRMSYSPQVPSKRNNEREPIS
jgi:holo-[acyl-carrier protein] synthase